MTMSRKYDDYYDDDYGSSFQKFPSKHKKPKRKGHQSRGQNSIKAQWIKQQENDEELLFDFPTTPTVTTTVKPKPQPQATTASTTPPKGQFQFGPNTREIKTIKIDMDGVESIEQIENIKDGRKTYGIRFNFKGNKGLFRIIWFNQNQYERDKVYATEYAFWLKLKK